MRHSDPPQDWDEPASPSDPVTCPECCGERVVDVYDCGTASGYARVLCWVCRGLGVVERTEPEYLEAAE